MNKITVFVSFLIILTLIASCTPAQTSESSTFIENQPETAVETVQSAPKTTIALVMKTLTNPFFVEMEKGARKAESELGIQLIVKTAAQETSIQQQIEIVEELINEKVDAIVIAPGDSKELIRSLKKAQDAGIVVVNIDNRLDEELAGQLGLVKVPFISVNNDEGAYLSAKYIADQIKTPTQVVILEGIREARNAQDRMNGAKRAFAENPNITIVASESAHWKIDEAHDMIGKIFDAHPDVKAVFCANDMMALGVVQYLDEKNITDVLVAGYDNLAEAQDAIKQGKMASTVDQQAALQGYTGIQYATKLRNGETVPLETYVNVILVTSTTLKD